MSDSVERVRRSDRLAEPVIALWTLAQPEHASNLGLAQADASTTDLSGNWRARVRDCAARAVAQIEAALVLERCENVRDDAQILLRACDDVTRGIEVDDAHIVPYLDIVRLIFTGLRPLLDRQNPPERRALALLRMRRYAGLVDGLTPLATSAEAETRARLAVPGLVMPYVGELRTSLGLAATLIDGMASMFGASGVADWQPAFDVLRPQLEAYLTFVRETLLPRARTSHQLPRAVYLERLRMVGVDIAPEELALQAHAAFDAIAAEMAELAPRVAAKKGFASSDYREVIRDLVHTGQITGDADDIVTHYDRRLREIEEICRREDLITLPDRPALIRIASLAESAEVPCAHMNPPPLAGNTGQRGEFVLPLDVPPAPGQDASERGDDFTHEAVTWTLTAHEARPGHELQFERMLQNGLPLAHALFAFNSANVEGWALYAEAIVLPFMPIEAQLCSLQARLHRAARAFLDPELQMGLRTVEETQAFLQREIPYSAAFSRGEVERYAFRSPGQATSYFYGYVKLVELRAEMEAALGASFSPKAFHDFIVDRGLVPPQTLRAAAHKHFSAPLSC